MKSAIILAILSILFIFNTTGQEHPVKTDSVQVIQEFKNLYRYQNFYIGGQPTYESLLWLKSRGVKRIINLRSEKENSDFSGSAFNEVNISQRAGIEYYSVPVDGLKDYTPEKLNALSSLLTQKDSILIHCASGVRATDFFMAYLVKNRGYSVNEAVEVGKKLKFTLPLEKLLDARIKVDLLKE
jgi:protein tyrosine phosphatase (PTP) superfamily phosphohydrolase (DUF442 family)